ncbi:hypothetical protein STENM327S_06358 [Streptomyces tendae]
MPMVTMVWTWAACGSLPPTRCSTSRSSTPATAAVTRTATASAPAKPMSSWRTATRYPPSSSSDPWVKLRTPEALKMVTKPRAIRAYTEPSARPLKRLSRKPVMPRPPPSWCRGRRGAPRGRPDLVGSAVGDGPAEVEDGDLVGEPHDQAHVVLHQHDGEAEFGADLPDDLGHADAFGGVHAGHGFVEQQYTGLQTEGASEFDAFAVAVRQQRDG